MPRQAGARQSVSTLEERPLKSFKELADDFSHSANRSVAILALQLGNVGERYVAGDIAIVLEFRFSRGNSKKYYAVFEISSRWESEVGNLLKVRSPYSFGLSDGANGDRSAVFCASVKLIQEEEIVVPSFVRFFRVDEVCNVGSNALYFQLPDLVVKRLGIFDDGKKKPFRIEAPSLGQLANCIVERRADALNGISDGVTEVGRQGSCELDLNVIATELSIALHNGDEGISIDKLPEDLLSVSKILIGPC